MMTNKLFIKYFLLFFSGLLLGSLGVYSYFNHFAAQSESKSSKAYEVHLGQKEFVNPLVDCNQWSDQLPPKANALKEKIENYINTSKNNKNTEQISVFYRDLLNGPQIEIDSNEKFAAASLLKVPILIYYMKLAEKKPEILKKKIKFSLKDSKVTFAVQKITPPLTLQDGQEYLVDELLSRMITFSDNYSAEMLLRERPELNISQLLTDMGITLDNIANDYWITVRGYSSIFRILYNATYLSTTMSNASLQLLSFSEFKVGLRAPLPENIKVSSKFGERESENMAQLHDCGIVYHPQRPYILCVMTRGQDTDKLIGAISDVSQIVWNDVNKKEP